MLVVGLITLLQQLPQSQMPFQEYANYAMGPLQVTDSFRIEPPTNFSIHVGVSYGVCFLLSSSNVDAIFTNGGPTVGFVPLQPFGAYPLQVYVHPGNGLRPMPGMH